MIEVDSLTVSGAAKQLASGNMSCVGLLEAVLARADKTEPLVHAYAHISREGALEAARKADVELAAGRSRGPLHGIPFAVKDLFCTHDAPTEGGSAVFRGYMAPKDAVVVSRLREAGAILVGKHVTHEFALGQNVPPTRNPWNLSHYPGGSSAGSGVSIAVGSSLLSIGTDAGGSVRKPACLTSTTGLKPTSGRISREGLLPPSASFDCPGPFARTAEDCALALQALAGGAADDRTVIDAPVRDYSSGLDAGVEGVRLGMADYFFGPELRDDVRPLVEAAIIELERLGVELVPVEVPALRYMMPAGLTIVVAEAAAAHRQLLAAHRDSYGEGTRRQLEFASLVPASHLDAAYRMQAELSAQLREVYQRAKLDGMVGPTLPRTSISLDEMVSSRDIPSFNPYTMPATLAGLPALTVPCGLTPSGLPAGLQIIGRPFDEATVLRVGHAYQQTTSWHERRPTLETA